MAEKSKGYFPEQNRGKPTENHQYFGDAALLVVAHYGRGETTNRRINEPHHNLC